MKIHKFLVLHFLLFMGYSNLSAQYLWNGGSGNWNDTSNWNCNCIPPASVGVSIYNSTSTPIVISSSIPVEVASVTLYGNVFLDIANFTATVLYAQATLDASSNIVPGNVELSGIYHLKTIYNGGTASGPEVIHPSKIVNNGQIFMDNDIGPDSISLIHNYVNASFINNNQLVFENRGQLVISPSNNTSFNSANYGTIRFESHKGGAIGTGIYFNNQGTITIKNASGQGTVGIGNGVGGTFISDGKLYIDSPIALANYGQMDLDGAAIDTFIGDVNQHADTLHIKACKHVFIDGDFRSYDVTKNYGIIKFKETNTPTFITTHLMNHGILVNNSNTNIFLSAANNPGALVQKKTGQHYAPCTITNMMTGGMTNILPASSIMSLDPLFALSAGTLNTADKSFTATTASVNQNTFYTNMYIGGCDAPPIGSPPLMPRLDVKFIMQNNIQSSIYYADFDFDGYGNPDITTESCTGPIFGYIANNGDCDDNRADVNPSIMDEYLLCSDRDYDCDGVIEGTITPTTYYRDDDLDGFGNASITTLLCAPEFFWVADNTDCDDTRFIVNPSSPEILDGLDNDCDGMIDEGFTITNTTFYGTIDNDWFLAGNWDNGVPDYSKHAIIEGHAIVNANAQARSVHITSGDTLVLHPFTMLNIKGGNGFGILNSHYFFSDTATLNIENIIGNGFQNN
ncbi:MAG: hypothetical protein RLZZ546_2247, partial [Bacteroidota bacterium]